MTSGRLFQSGTFLRENQQQSDTTGIAITQQLGGLGSASEGTNLVERV